MKKYRKVWTPSGLQDGPMNSLVGKGESIINFNTGKAALVTDGRKGIDNQPSSVKPNDDNVIAGNDIDWIGYKNGNSTRPITFADQMAPISAQIQAIDDLGNRAKISKLSSLAKRTAQFQQDQINKAKQPLLAEAKNIADRQELQHNLENDPRYGAMFANKGKDGIPKFDGGLDAFGRMLPNIIQSGAGLAQLLHYAKEPVQYHNTYVDSPYSNKGLQELNKLRFDPYPAIQASREAERRNAYGLSQAGGLSGSQRFLGRIGLALDNQRNAANAFTTAQQQNNAYRQAYAQALLNEGNQIATRKQSANQHDWQDFVSAHGRKTKGIEGGLYNLINAANSAYQNQFKYNTWQQTNALYNQQLALDKQRVENDLENARANLAIQKQIANTYLTPTLTGNTTIDYLGAGAAQNRLRQSYENFISNLPVWLKTYRK